MRFTRLVLLTLVWWGGLCTAQAHDALVHSIEAVGVTVSELDASVVFFEDVLGFEKLWEREVAGRDYELLEGVFAVRMRVARLRLGGEFIELTEYLAPKGRPIPVDSKSNDLWFQHIAIIVSDMEKAYRHLRVHHVEHASSGPQRLPDWNEAAGGIEAFYFKDPDGHNLEILHFPPDKGDPKWHEQTDKLFLGIDHTAIAVSDTEVSLELYHDVLGLSVAGESENYGPEQERLNSVFGARLRITALRATSGPGIELLEYLTPIGGRPPPVDLHANDVVHWQTQLRVAGADAAFEKLRTARVQLVSPVAIELEDAVLGYESALLVRDPDGHALLLVQKR